MPIEVNPVIRRAGAILRRERPLLRDEWQYTVRRERAWTPVMGGTHELTLLFFRSSGCRFSKAGECTMCDYQIAAPLERDEMVANVREALASHPGHEALFVAPLGSMFDPREVPPAACDEICALMAATDARLLATETRMEFLAPNVVEHFASFFPERERRINIGLESTDPWLLAHAIGKSIPVERLGATAALLHHHGVELAANVLVGPPLLTPREVVRSAVETVRTAVASGVGLCVLFPSNVRRWTVQHWLWEQGWYHPPSLWAFVEIVTELQPHYAGHLALSYFDKEPNDSIVVMPTTCPDCRERVTAALWSFAATGSDEELARVRRRGCACRDTWLRSLDGDGPPLADRARAVYESMGRRLAGEEWWEHHRAEVIDTLYRPALPHGAAA